MTLTLQRDSPTLGGAILGTLSINGLFECYTLEGALVEIPAGWYPVTITKSERFGRMLPLIENVPGRSGIRIHPGNSTQDTEGCILLGLDAVGDEVLDSRKACEAFQPKIAAALAAGETVNIQIIDP